MRVVRHTTDDAFAAGRLRLMLAMAGYELDNSSRILDFGCGAGGVVRAFRDAGLNAFGYDIHDCVPASANRDWFAVGAASARDRLDFTIGEDFGLPFPDGHFDVVYSCAVMEHVQNHEAVFRELARVTKRPGIGIHAFPTKWMPIEGHMNVPLGGVLTGHWWFLLWAMLGVRNEYQTGKPAAEVAALNFRYSSTGLNHRALRNYVRICARHFDRVSFRPDLYEYPAIGMRPWMASAFLRGLRTRFNQAVLVVEKITH